MELETNEFVNSNQFLKQMDLQNPKEDLSNFFSKSNFYFELDWIFLGKELLPSFSSRPRKGKIGPQGELREVGRVI
jgi:hypothetical protein